MSGGGVAGLSAACLSGGRVPGGLCVDPAPPVTERDAAARTCAPPPSCSPARDLLDEAGLWARLAPDAAPLQVMRIVDAGGRDPGPRDVKEFDAAEISGLPFGWNLPNWLLRREMVAQMAAVPRRSDFRPGTRWTRWLPARARRGSGCRTAGRCARGW